MHKTDEDALICDFAETYQIYDYRQLPPTRAAVLAVGLRDSSRIKMMLSNTTVTPDIMLLAATVDRLSLLVWAQTKDAEKGRNRPKSILESLTPKESKTVSFASGEDFINARNQILQQAGG